MIATETFSEEIALCPFPSFAARYLEARTGRGYNMLWRAVKNSRQRKRLFPFLLESSAGYPPRPSKMRARPGMAPETGESGDGLSRLHSRPWRLYTMVPDGNRSSPLLQRLEGSRGPAG